MTASLKPYRLMHKNILVAELQLDMITGGIASVGKVYAEEHVPIGVSVRKHMLERGALNRWCHGRAIPASRAGLQNALQQLNVSDAQLLAEKCLGLSLSDQYWICPEASELHWEQVNFFENPFSEDVGNILLGAETECEQISLMSPDNTSDGWLQKKWVIRDGKRCLIKGGSGAIRQEPYNEVLASSIMNRLEIPHVTYSLTQEGGYPYSICEDFITPDTELISAWHIMQTRKKENHVSVYQHYKNCCSRLGIPDIQRALDQMVVLDYLIVNEDRHMNNFGVIRRADTLEYLGAAPIFDSGTSLWFDKPTALIRADAKVTCKPFKTTHEEQLKLVTDFSWLDLSALNGITDEWCEIVKDSLFVDKARREAICTSLSQRIKMLENLILSMPQKTFCDIVQHDVKQDIAYSGETEDRCLEMNL